MCDPYQLGQRHAASVDLMEGDCRLSFTRDDFVRYSGPDQIIATALMFQMFTRVFGELAPGGLVDRNRLSVIVGFPGPGIMDCIELVLRGRTRNNINITVKTEDLPEEAPLALIGRFYYEFDYEGMRLALWPVDGFFTDEFRSMVKQFQPRKGGEEDQARYQAFKHDMVKRLMAAKPEDLFHIKRI